MRQPNRPVPPHPQVLHSVPAPGVRQLDRRALPGQVWRSRPGAAPQPAALPEPAPLRPDLAPGLAERYGAEHGGQEARGRDQSGRVGESLSFLGRSAVRGFLLAWA
jgi:hypothetical protein